MTDIVLNQNVPGGVMKQLADAAGGVTYNQYAPGGPVEQLRHVVDDALTLDQYAPGGPLHQIEVDIEGSGGGGIPPLPDGFLFVVNDGDYVVDGGSYTITET